MPAHPDQLSSNSPIAGSSKVLGSECGCFGGAAGFVEPTVQKCELVEAYSRGQPLQSIQGQPGSLTPVLVSLPDLGDE